MTARFSLNLRNTRGHRPRLQWPLILTPEKAACTIGVLISRELTALFSEDALMRSISRFWMIATIGTCIALSAVLATAQTPAYRAPRTADGKPDLNGIWQALNEAD